MAIEIPVGTVLSLLTNQVIKTALAAKDVLIQRESFKVLSQHLSDIEPVLRELQLRELNDSQEARKALEFFAEDVKKANDLVEKYKNRARFYLLLKCRHIVKEIQDVTRLIGRSLAALHLASAGVLTDVSEQVNRLHNEMQRAQFEASKSQLQIVQKLDQGLKDEKVDQDFANDILEEIAKAVGVAIEPSEISRELASFRQEKEEAAIQKNKAEEYFLQQVIELLSRADAAKDQEEIKKHYFQRVKTIEKESGDHIPPLPSFICPIECRDVMVDPVSLCTGTTCEKEAIEAWIKDGQRIDPKTGEPLEDLSLRSNHLLRKSIEEWRELNYCLRIRSAKRKLLSEMDTNVDEALVEMQKIMTEKPITKDWISIEGLVDICLSILGSSHNKDIKWRVLVVLKATVEGNITNKENIIESQGINHIAPCLGRSSKVSNAAVELLFDLLQDDNGWNLSACRKLSEQSSAILLLVMLMNTTESVDKAEKILLQLCNDDDSNVIRAAKSNWYKPLIDRLVQGPETSRLLMVKTLVQMELVDESLKCLGEAGAIPPLLEMVSGNLEAKVNALSTLVKLSACHENKRLIASAGGVRLILDILFSQAHTKIIAKCCEILERLSSNDDGTAFFIDANGNCLELDQIVIVLLEFQKNPNSSCIIRKPALHALLGICKSQQSIVMNTVVIANGVSVILPMLDDFDQEIQEASLNLLYRISHHEPEQQKIVKFLLTQRRLDKLVVFLNDDSRKNVQMAAVGLLANLPKSETDLTKKLIESHGLQSMVNILRSGTLEAKENALSALSRFTDPKNLESQRLLVELGMYPLLLSFLNSGTLTAKARAAALIGNLSLSSPKLTVMSKSSSFWCFRNTQVPTCKAHGGICSVTSTFCILQADALPELTRLLHEKVHAVAYKVLQALFTLVSEDKYHGGAIVLHEANAIGPVLEVLNWGNPSLKEESLRILEKVFLSKKMVELYGAGARIHLIGLTTRNIHEDDALRSKANRVMTQLDRYSRSSMSMPLV